jgi:hypothetical protein
MTKTIKAVEATARTSADVARELSRKRATLERLKAASAEAQAKYDEVEHALALAGVAADEGDETARAQAAKLDGQLDAALRVLRGGMLKREVVGNQIAALERELDAVNRQEALDAIAAKAEVQRQLGAQLKVLFSDQLIPLVRRYVAAAEAMSAPGTRAIWEQIAEALGAALLANVPELWKAEKVRHLCGDVHRPLDFEFWAGYNAVRAVKNVAPVAAPPQVDDPALEAALAAEAARVEGVG